MAAKCVASPCLPSLSLSAEKTCFAANDAKLKCLAPSFSKHCLLSASTSGRPQAARSLRLLQCRASAGPDAGALSPELKVALDDFISKHKVVVFMKGDRNAPQCGFSNTVVQVMNALSAPYETVDILSNPQLREGMKIYSSWPTFPQVYVEGEFYGGCDIVMEGYQSGELKELLEKVSAS